MDTKTSKVRIVEKEEVLKLFEELLPWDKVELIEELYEKYINKSGR